MHRRLCAGMLETAFVSPARRVRDINVSITFEEQSRPASISFASMDRFILFGIPVGLARFRGKSIYCVPGDPFGLLHAYNVAINCRQSVKLQIKKSQPSTDNNSPDKNVACVHTWAQFAKSVSNTPTCKRLMFIFIFHRSMQLRLCCTRLCRSFVPCIGIFHRFHRIKFCAIVETMRTISICV